MPFTAKNSFAKKLTVESVIKMRQLYAKGGYTQEELARMFKVTSNTVRNVVNGVTWQNIPLVKSDNEIVGENKLMLMRAKESERKFKEMMGITDDPPPAVAERFADDLAKAVELNNELEGLKK